MKAGKRRADEELVARGLVESRNKAQALIMAGKAEARDPRSGEWSIVKKAGQPLAEGIELRVNGANNDVGRGALKLRQAFASWPLKAEGATALDIGSSTGGFTQVLLEHGAVRVLALDVGTHQLHERLRADPRVVSLEQQHVLKMDEAAWQKAGLRPPFDIMVTDLSFISATKIIETASAWLKPGGDWIILVKPQFEVGPKKAPGGIVRDEAFHKEALDLLRSAVKSVARLEWKEVIPSPISGGDGNKEFLLWLKQSD